MHLLKDFVRVDRVLNAVAAGTTDQTSAAVDMQADVIYDEVTFIALFGTLTATQVTSLRIQTSNDDGVADAYTDIAGTASVALADGDSNKALAVSIRPKERYVKCIIDRATANAVIDGMIAILSKPHKIPTAQSTDIVGWETHDYPAEGTA